MHNWNVATALAALAIAGSCAPPDGASASPAALAQAAEEEWARRPASPVLLEALERGSPALRARAARAMGRIQDPGYAEPLARAVADEDPAVRREAWFALGQLGLAPGTEVPPRAIEAARSGLATAEPSDKALAVEALGKLAPLGAAESLVPFLGHSDPRVRGAAADALMRLRFVPTWRGETEEPPPLPEAAVEALAAALDDPDDAVRRKVAHALSRYGEPDAAAGLAARQEDPDPWVRVFAVRGVGRAGATDLADAIRWGLADEDPHVRTEAVAALATLGRADLVVGGLDTDGEPLVRAAVAAALGTAEGAGSLDRLRRLAGDPATTVRAAAIGALARRLRRGYADELQRQLSDPSSSWVVRRAAAQATAELGEAAVPLLLRAAQDPDPRVRAAVVGTLGPFQQSTDAQSTIDGALRSDDLEVRAAAAQAVADSARTDRLDVLTAVFERSAGLEWIELREAVVDAVATLDGAETLLRRAAADPAPSVRSRARQALTALGGEAIPEESASPEAPAVAVEAFAQDPRVVLETDRGEIEILCFAAEAPLHVSSFVGLVRRGFYDGLIWHRVVPNFVVQGGDPLGNGWGGPGYVLPDEIHPEPFVRGTVGMPKAGKDTGGCQLFITHLPTPHLDGNYTVFGRVVRGIDVVDRIEIGDRIRRARVLE